MHQANIPKMSKVQSLEGKISGILAQDLQLVQEVKRPSKPDQQELEHLTGRDVDGVAFRLRRDVINDWQGFVKIFGNFLKLNLLKLFPRFLNHSDIFEAFVIVEPVDVLVDEHIEGGDLDV